MAKKKKKKKQKAENGNKSKRKIAITITTKLKYLKTWKATGAWIKTNLLPIFKLLKKKKMQATKENILNAFNDIKRFKSQNGVPNKLVLTYVIEEALKRRSGSKYGMKQVGKKIVLIKQYFFFFFSDHFFFFHLFLFVFFLGGQIFMTNATRLLSTEERTEQQATIQVDYNKLRIETFRRKFEPVNFTKWNNTKPARRIKDTNGKLVAYYILKEGELY